VLPEPAGFGLPVKLKANPMAKIYFDPLVIGTFQRLFGATAFLEAIDTAIPTLEANENQYLERLSAQEGWDYSDYAIEKLELDAKFRTWVPTFATYSVIILLHSVIETQLFGFAERLGKNRGAKLRVKDLGGRGIQQSALYLECVVSFPVREDPAWALLQDLQSLRNIIVHRGGNRGNSPDQQKVVEVLVRRHPHKLELRKADGIHEQIWVSMNLVRDFAGATEGFFERIFKSAGLPNRHLQMDS
jgi:hypothetical protein